MPCSRGQNGQTTADLNLVIQIQAVGMDRLEVREIAEEGSTGDFWLHFELRGIATPHKPPFKADTQKPPLKADTQQESQGAVLAAPQ